MKIAFLNLLVIFTLAFSVIACSTVKTAGKVMAVPVKGVYYAGKYTGKAAIWTGKRFVKTGETVVNVTNAALDTTSKTLVVVSQIISISGRIVTVTSRIKRSELEATIAAARISKEVVSIMIDVVT